MSEPDNPQEQKPEWEARFERVDDLQELAALQEEADSPEASSFTIAGRYQVVATLGQGGMGAVYRAHDTTLDRTVAIKTILPQHLSGEQASRRFFREARALARLNHPNILTLHDYGQDKGMHYLVMELGGRDLGRILQSQGGPLPLEQARHVGMSVCRALDYAHGHGVVHRDLKPGNILVGSADAPGWAAELSSTPVKVVDFGLARVRGASAITAPFTQLGTPQYMSPEQVLGREADERSDLYSLGVVLYELCAGVRPFDSDDSEAILHQHLNLPPVPPSAFNAQIPQALEVLILRLLEKDPSRRPASAGEVLRTLEGLSAPALPGTPVPGAAPAPSPLGILPARTPLVGRERELEFLKGQYEAVAAGGGGRLILVSGEPGVGKTRLIRELGVYARVRGGQFLEGRYLKEGTPPYGPWVEALQSGMKGLDKEQMTQLVGSYGAELSQILPGLVEQVGPFPALTGSPEEQRTRLYNGVAAFVANLSQQKPLVLLLDDLQWAPGITLLSHVARRLADSKALLLGAYREQEFKESAELVRQWGELNRERLFTPLSLTALSEQETARMLAHHFGEVAGEQLGEPVYRRTRGNPFFTEEVVRSLAESGAVRPRDGGWEVADVFRVSIPDSVKLAVEERVSRLGEGAREVLVQAAVLGQEFSFPVLLAMTGLLEDDLVKHIDRALAARLIADRSVPGEERYAFADDQIQEVLYGSISGPRRRRLHLRAGQALENIYADRLDAHLEELARHFVEGNDPEKGADYSYRAGLKADRLYNWPRAIPLYRTALELWEELGGHLEERARVCESLGDASYKSTIDTPLGIGYLEKALVLYEELGDLRKQATLHSQIGREYGFGANARIRDFGKAFEHLHQARRILEELPESMALGLVYLTLDSACSRSLQMIEQISWVRKALEVGERLQRPAVVAQAHTHLGGALIYIGEVPQGLAALEEGWRLASQNNLAYMSDENRYEAVCGPYP